MPGPNWADDDAADASTAANIAKALGDARGLAASPSPLTQADLRRRHRITYQSCTVPASADVGGFRGDGHCDRYEVGIGPPMVDGFPERMGVWACDVQPAVGTLFGQIGLAFAALDAVVAAGSRPTHVDVLAEVVGVAAAVHASGSGSTRSRTGTGGPPASLLLTLHFATRSRCS